MPIPRNPPDTASAERLPTTEEELRAAHVDQPPMRLDGPVLLAEYDPAWPALYAREAERVRAALGKRVLLEHVGSTSVPGLLGLPRDYLAGQLGAWKSGIRHALAPDCMAEIAERLNLWIVSECLHGRFIGTHPAEKSLSLVVGRRSSEV